MKRTKALGRLASVALLLLLAACASGPSKTSASTAEASSSNTVQLNSKLPAGTGMASTFDVALADPATPAAQAAAAAIGARIGACWKGPNASAAPAVLLD